MAKNINKVDNQKINQLTDLLDYASMLYYEEKEATYLECLSKVLESYMEELDLPFDEEKVMKWLANGAKPTDTVKSLLTKEGYIAKFLASKKAE